MTVFEFFAPIKKRDISDFMQKMSMLLEAGYDSCAAVTLLAGSTDERRRRTDRSADGIRKVAKLLLPSLLEGYALYEAMGSVACFRDYTKQVEVGEKAGKTSEVLLRVSDQIRMNNNTMMKLRGAMAYPAFTLLIALAAATYLFSSVIPDMLSMFLEFGGTEIPAMTQIVLNIGAWMKKYWEILFIFMFGVPVAVFIYGKTRIGRLNMAYVYAKTPYIGKIIENNSVAIFLKGWQQMLMAGAEMSVALATGAESVPNLYMRRALMLAKEDYASNGVPVHTALSRAPFISEVEKQTIQVAITGDKMERTLSILAEDRELEASRSVNNLTSAVNPILTVFIGLIVGVLVMAVYEPVMSFSTMIE